MSASGIRPGSTAKPGTPSGRLVGRSAQRVCEMRLPSTETATATLLGVAALVLVLRCRRSSKPAASTTPPPKRVAVRNAEKDRVSTCAFADCIAGCAIEAFERLSAEAGLKYRQTVVAAVVCVRREAGSEPSFRAVSLGAGTKFLRAAQIREDVEGARVRDCHAEVLARRAFQRYLHVQLLACMRGQPSVMLPPERPGERFRLAPGVSFHLYSSSQPCGNASAKRWAKSTCGPRLTELPAAVCPEAEHARLQVPKHARLEVMPATLCVQPTILCIQPATRRIQPYRMHCRCQSTRA